ncbi:MAG: flavin reductase family protein [Negativicutes bacterium]|nr:flavin reductase family protein [Negativicutes bacterium]
METVDFRHTGNDFLSRLPAGAFLTANDGGRTNVMTIGWGGLGYIWRQPVVIALIRPTRHTWHLIEKSGEFAVSIPEAGQMKDALAVCGSRSGRETDKIALCSLDLIEPRIIATKLIAGCELYYECKLLARHDLDPAKLDPAIDQQWYPAKDYHTVYYGQIMAAYRG